jgi:hypothetical protein
MHKRITFVARWTRLLSQDVFFDTKDDRFYETAKKHVLN